MENTKSNQPGQQKNADTATNPGQNEEISREAGKENLERSGADDAELSGALDAGKNDPVESDPVSVGLEGGMGAKPEKFRTGENLPPGEDPDDELSEIDSTKK